MLAVDVVDLQKIKKRGSVNTGLNYLQWLGQQSWYEDQDVLKQIIIDYLDGQDVGYVPELKEEPEPPKKTKKEKIIVSHD